MDQAWCFPAVAPLPGRAPAVMLAERSLPGCLIVDQTGIRFVNETTDYMSFGQRLLALERSGSPVEAVWLVLDQRYRNSNVFAANLFPRMAVPQTWDRAGIAARRRFRRTGHQDRRAHRRVPRHDVALQRECLRR